MLIKMLCTNGISDGDLDTIYIIFFIMQMIKTAKSEKTKHVYRMSWNNIFAYIRVYSLENISTIIFN